MKTKKLILVSALFCATALLAGCGNTHSHNYGSLVPMLDAKCEEAGHLAYYHCDGCDKYFNEDKQEKTLDELTIAPKGHDWKPQQGQNATCTVDGWKAYYDCSRCDSYAETAQGGNKFTDLDAWKKGAGKIAAAHTLVPQSGQEATCLVDGWKDYYKCSVCDKLYEDQQGAVEITNFETWKSGNGKLPKHVDQLTKHNGTPATCLTDGFKDYYECGVCGVFYEDANATVVIDDVDVWKMTDGFLGKHVNALTLVQGLPKTCTTDGYRDAYKCDECGKYYLDAQGKELIGDANAYATWILNDGKIPASHNLEHHEAKNPTGFISGNTEYYKCLDCGKYFSDSKATNIIEEGSWVIPATGKVTFDSAEQIATNTSKEGDVFALDKYGMSTQDGYIATIEPAQTFEGQQWNGYIEFPELHGIKQLSIKGTGSIYFRTGSASWTWNSALAHVTLAGDDTATVIKLDPERDNSIIISSNGGRVLLKELSFISVIKDGKGSTDTDLLQHVTINEGITSTNAYGYFTDTDTNNSKSALVVGAFSNVDSWPFVCLDLPGEIDIRDYNLTFDAKGNGGRNRFSITPLKDGSAVGTEIGWDLTSSWATYSYNGDLATDKVNQIRITVFTSNVADKHENVIDNVRLTEIGIITETNSGAWSYRAFDQGHGLLETQYANKAVALDFKPESDSAAFEIDYMFDANTYVGKKNYITVTGGVPSSTFGKITEKGDGWYTLTVSGLNICANTRVNNGNINGIYIATDSAMSGSVTFAYRSIRAVADIAPDRRVQTVDASHSGISLWGGAVNDTVAVKELNKGDDYELLLSVKVDGDVGSTVTMNFANEGDVTQRIFASITLTVTEEGLSTDVGRITKAVDDGWYNLIIKRSQVNTTELNAAGQESYLTVFWCNNGAMTVRSITFDANSIHVYAPGILA